MSRGRLCFGARARTPMYALDGLAGLLLVLGLLLGKRGDQGINTIPRWVRMSSSALVLLGALLQARAGPPGQRRLTAAGMGCGFAGDLIMAELTGLPGACAVRHAGVRRRPWLLYPGLRRARASWRQRRVPSARRCRWPGWSGCWAGSRWCATRRSARP
ncbi:MAG: hypothetical protein U0Z44_16335 [Kouleothrix sp.]